MIRVNGKKENYSVDLSKSIELSWSDTHIPQASYILSFQTQEGEKLYQKEEQTSKPFHFVMLDELFFHTRKKIEVSLSIIDKDGNEHIETSCFYTENKKIAQSKWITRQDNPIEKENEYYKDKPNIILSQTFQLTELKEKFFFLDIVGLGYYTVYLNNQRIDKYYLNTDVTNYDKRVYYDAYRIDDYLVEGKNEIIVELANGWYNPAPLLLLGKYNLRNQLSIGKPCLLAQVTEIVNGKQRIILESNSQWQSGVGNYLFDNVYIGERVHYPSVDLSQLERKVERKTIEIPGPSGELIPSFIPKIKRKEKLLPKNVHALKKGYLIEFDQVISGHFSCVFKTKREDTIYLKYSETIDNEGLLDFESSSPGSYGDLRKKSFYPAIQEDQVTVGEGRQRFENQFTYHSFKYVLIDSSNEEIELEDIYAYKLHTDMERSGAFKSSSQWMNQLYNVSVATKLNNIHSYYEDCPRERLGYGGDIVALIHSQIHSFQSKELLEKVLDDFELDQTSEGGITQTAPFMGIQTHGTSNRAGSLGWQYVVPTILKKLIKHYGEANQYKNKLPFVKKHASYLLSFDYDYIKYCCLGDWGSIDTALVEGKETPPDRLFCSAVFYLLSLEDYKELIKLLAKEQEEAFIEELQKKIQLVKQSIIEEFYQIDGYFGSGSQSSYLFGLKANLGEDQELIYDNFIQKVKTDDGVLRMGIFGMAWAYEYIKHEDQSLLSQWLTRKEHPSFYKMLENEANILSEYFTDDPEKYHHVSRNHAMFSSYGSWFIDSVLGIKTNEKAYASNQINIEPYFPEGLSFAKGHLETPHGRVDVSWERMEEGYHYTIRIPLSIEANCEKGEVLREEAVENMTEYHLFYSGN